MASRRWRTVKQAAMLQRQSRYCRKIMVPMMQLSHFVFRMPRRSCSIQRVDATDCAKQKHACMGGTLGDGKVAHECRTEHLWRHTLGCTLWYVHDSKARIAALALSRAEQNVEHGFQKACSMLEYDL
jgi:hypothetical protein